MSQHLRCDGPGCENQLMLSALTPSTSIVPWLTLTRSGVTTHYCGNNCLAQALAVSTQAVYPDYDTLVSKMVESIDIFYQVEEEEAGDPPSKIRFLAAWLIGESWVHP